MGVQFDVSMYPDLLVRVYDFVYFVTNDVQYNCVVVVVVVVVGWQ